MVTIAAGHTITVPEGTAFEVGRVSFAANNSRLVMAGANSQLRYTTADRGYVAEDCCNTPQPAGVDAIVLTSAGGANTTYRETANRNGEVSIEYNVTGNIGNLQLTRPVLPDGARFVRWISNLDGNTQVNVQFIPDPTDSSLTTTYQIDKSPSPGVSWIIIYIQIEYTDPDGCNNYYTPESRYMYYYN
ncbi:MAG: hypothetical protein ACO3M9_01825 [Flavobacteriaceae bacterium]